MSKEIRYVAEAVVVMPPPEETPEHHALLVEVAERLLESPPDKPPTAKGAAPPVLRFLGALASLYDERPGAVYLILDLLSRQSVMNLSYSEQGERWGMSKQAVHERRGKDLKLIATNFPELVGIINSTMESAGRLRESERVLCEDLKSTGKADR